MLAPLTKQQAVEAGVELRAHHIVVAQQEQNLLEQVLAAVPKRSRPIVHLADPKHLLTNPAGAGFARFPRSEALLRHAGA